MNANQFFIALNDIDIPYIQEAETFSRRKREHIIRRIIPAATAACLSLILAAVFLGRPASSELPSLTFSRISDNGVSSSDYLIAWPEDSVTRSLEQKELASIWGMDVLSWEGVQVWEKYLMEAQVTLGSDGKVWNITIWGYSSQDAKKNGMGAFSINMCPDSLPPQCCTAPAKSYTLNDIWGTEVLALTSGGGRGYGPPDEPGSYYSDCTHYITEFLREGQETIGIRAEMTVDPIGLQEDEAKDLLTRFTSQSLRPETILSFSQLISNN